MNLPFPIQGKLPVFVALSVRFICGLQALQLLVKPSASSASAWSLVWGLSVGYASRDTDGIPAGGPQRETTAVSRLPHPGWLLHPRKFLPSCLWYLHGTLRAKGSLPLPGKPFLQSAKHPFRLEQLLTSTEFGRVQAEDFKAESNIISKFMRNPSSPKCTNVLPEKWELLPES